MKSETDVAWMKSKVFKNGDWSAWSQQRKFIATGEFRPPKFREWFISGAIPEAYQAGADLKDPYWIAIEIGGKWE